MGNPDRLWIEEVIVGLMKPLTKPVGDALDWIQAGLSSAGRLWVAYQLFLIVVVGIEWRQGNIRIVEWQASLVAAATFLTLAYWWFTAHKRQSGIGLILAALVTLGVTIVLYLGTFVVVHRAWYGADHWLCMLESDERAERHPPVGTLRLSGLGYLLFDLEGCGLRVYTDDPAAMIHPTMWTEVRVDGACATSDMFRGVLSAEKYHDLSAPAKRVLKVRVEE